MSPAKCAPNLGREITQEKDVNQILLTIVRTKHASFVFQSKNPGKPSSRRKNIVEDSPPEDFKPLMDLGLPQRIPLLLCTLRTRQKSLIL